MRAPFDIRITEVKANLAQYANKGQQLFSADGIASAEVEAQFAIGNLMKAIPRRSGRLPGPPVPPGWMRGEAINNLSPGV